MYLTYTVTDNTYETINQIIKDEFNISTRLFKKLIDNQKVLLNNKIIDTRTNVSIGDIITVLLDLEEDNSNVVPTKMDLDIIYEDDYFLVVNKPAGITIHPSRMHYDNSLSNGVRWYFDKLGLKKKIRPVNRLDIDTSGLVIFAKNEYIQECFVEQMKNNIFEKYYLALVNGIFDKKQGTINLPIKRKEESIIERCISNDGQLSITHYNILKKFNTYSLVECKLETGRTHQIRVHMSYISHPILGDTLYGNSSNLINRQALHSYKIKCIHPILKTEMEFIAELPTDMNNLITDI